MGFWVGFPLASVDGIGIHLHPFHGGMGASSFIPGPVVDEGGLGDVRWSRCMARLNFVGWKSGRYSKFELLFILADACLLEKVCRAWISS